MNYSGSQQIEIGASIHLPLDKLQTMPCPSVYPLLHSLENAASTALKSRWIPLTNPINSGMPLSCAFANQFRNLSACRFFISAENSCTNSTASFNSGTSFNNLQMYRSLHSSSVGRGLNNSQQVFFGDGAAKRRSLALTISAVLRRQLNTRHPLLKAAKKRFSLINKQLTEA